MGGNVTENWHTLAGRLRWAIDQTPSSGRQRGLRLFQRRIEEHAPDVHGTSLSAIQGYLRDDGEPSLAFVRQAAVLLAVREPWLAVGHGAPTEEEEAGTSESPEADLYGVSTAIYKALGVPTKVEGGAERFFKSAVWAPVARQTVLRLYQLRPGWELLTGVEVAEEDPDTAWERAIKDTAIAIAAPLRALGVDARHLELNDVADYVAAMALTLQQTMRRYVPGTDPREIPPLAHALLEGFRVEHPYKTEDQDEKED